MVSSRPLPLNNAPEKDLGYGQIFMALLRRKHWLVLGVLGGLAVSGFMSLRQVPSYSSGMQVLIEAIYQSKTQRTAGTQTAEITDSNVEIDSATQISFLQSSGLVKKAMEGLRSEYPEFNPDNPGSVGAFKQSLSVMQAASSDKKATTPTKIFQINYQANDPVKAQKVLSALQKVYLEYNREQQALRLTKGLNFIDQQLPTISQKLQQSESRLEGFRRNQELIDPKMEAQRQSDQFAKAQDELKTNISQIQDLRSRYETLRQQLPTTPAQTTAMSRLTQSVRYQTLLTEIQKTELALVQQRLKFKDDTPYVKQILDQRQQQMALLQTEAERILGETNASEETLRSSGQLTQQDIAAMTQFADATVALKAAEARYAGLQQNVEALRGNLKRFPQILAEYGRLEPEVELNRDTLKQLLRSRQELGLEIARGSFDWQIVEEPQLGMKTSTPVTQSMLLGAIVGLFLGGAVAFARESMDDAVHTSDDFKKQFPVPLLGMVPSFSDSLVAAPGFLKRPAIQSLDSAPIQQLLHWQPFRESLDLIYQSLQLLNQDSSIKSLVITSALAGEGKSTFAIGLAMSAARLHRRVLLIDGDLRSPSIHTMLGLPNQVGLANLLEDNSPIPMLPGNADQTGYGNLSVLTAGTGTVDSAKLLSSQRLRRLISSFEKSYDLVIVDTPPMLGMVDSMLLSSRCSGALLVGRIGKVTRSELVQASASLNHLNLIAVIANDISLPTANPRYESSAMSTANV